MLLWKVDQSKVKIIKNSNSRLDISLDLLIVSLNKSHLLSGGGDCKWLMKEKGLPVNSLIVIDCRKLNGVVTIFPKLFPRSEICSKLTVKTPERGCSGVFINFEHILHLVQVFLLLTLSKYMPAGTGIRDVFGTLLNICDETILQQQSTAKSP